LFEDSDFAVYELFLAKAFDNDVDREQGYSLEYLETAAPTLRRLLRLLRPLQRAFIGLHL
jgi:hypothetical protein